MTITSHVDYSDLLYTLSCRRAAARRQADQEAADDRALAAYEAETARIDHEWRPRS